MGDNNRTRKQDVTGRARAPDTRIMRKVIANSLICAYGSTAALSRRLDLECGHSYVQKKSMPVPKSKICEWCKTAAPALP